MIFMRIFVMIFIMIFSPIESGPRFSGAFQRDVTLSKTHMKNLDQPSERCSKDIVAYNTSACIANYIEDALGCNARIHGGSPAKKGFCNNMSQLRALAKVSKELEDANENQIYDLTGCLAPCEKDKYHKMDASEQKSTEIGLKLRFAFVDGSYEEKEQYLIYDFDSFIADVGGFLGLLLGFSIFSIYKDMAVLITRMKGKVMTNQRVMRMTSLTGKESHRP